MMRNFYILTVCLFIFSLSNVKSQDKVVEKEWAKKMKDLKPLDYKNLVEERDALKKQVDESGASKTAMASKDAEIASLKTELENTKKMMGDSEHHPAVAGY